MTTPYIPRLYHFDTQHDGTAQLAINDTPFRRLLTRIALHTTARFYSQEGLCVPVSRNIIVKTGRRIHLTEGATMKYLADNTSIPVPKVYCSFLHKNRAYIVMERIRGKDIPHAWKSLSEESLEGIFVSLKKIIDELRALPPARSVGVESCVGGSLYDSRIAHGNPRFGPFKTIQEFHCWLRKDLKPEDLENREQNQDWRDLQDMMIKQDGPWPAPKFTHGDMNPFNIIVRNGKLVGVIDWEFAGWYPHYWEFTSAWFGNVTRGDWQDMLERFLERPEPEILKMEEVRNKWWGE